LRYTVIGNGVELELFRPPAISNAREPAPVRCLAVTRLIERKGVADLLRAWCMLERGRYALEIAGGGPDEARLRALAAELGVEREITFAGALPREEIARRCQRAHLFVLAPYEEAFGNVFAEALSAGLPIVASNVGAIPSLVKHGDNGLLVAPGDCAAIARAIRDLGEDPERRAIMSARNRTRAETTLSWDTAAGNYLSLYAELIDERREAAL
jgi:glycosyltransferase involved in cell wall biosynthesis